MSVVPALTHRRLSKVVGGLNQLITRYELITANLQTTIGLSSPGNQSPGFGRICGFLNVMSFRGKVYSDLAMSP